VFKNRPRNSEALKATIVEQIAAIPREMTERVMQRCRLRITSCIDSGGRRMPDVIFHTYILHAAYK